MEQLLNLMEKKSNQINTSQHDTFIVADKQSFEKLTALFFPTNNNDINNNNNFNNSKLINVLIIHDKPDSIIKKEKKKIKAPPFNIIG